MGRFKGRLRCNGLVNSIIIHLITDEIIYRYFRKYKYNVRTCMYTISALYQIIN